MTNRLRSTRCPNLVKIVGTICTESANKNNEIYKNHHTNQNVSYFSPFLEFWITLGSDFSKMAPTILIIFDPHNKPTKIHTMPKFRENCWHHLHGISEQKQRDSQKLSYESKRFLFFSILRILDNFRIRFLKNGTNNSHKYWPA